MKRWMFVVSGFILACSVTSSAHATAIRSWWATTAVADSYGSSGGHAFYFFDSNLPGAKRFVFDGLGRFDEIDNDMNGTYDEAHLYGTVVSTSGSHPHRKWDVDVWFVASGPGVDSPKKELSSTAYSENGGPVDTDTWRYYTMVTSGLKNSVLTGLDYNSGLTFDLYALPLGNKAPFQIGIGANGKNINFGASSWFSYDVNGQDIFGNTPASGIQADINIDLLHAPEPGTVMLFGVGLLGMVGYTWHRRKRAA